MEKLGFQASAPKGVKLSKPPPRKLTKTEVILNRLENGNFNNGILELSMLEQSRSVELNNNYIEKSCGVTPGSDPASLNCLSNVSENVQDNNVDLKQRARAPRTAKLTKPRPLRSNAASRNTSLDATEVNNNVKQDTSYTSHFSSIRSSEEAEDKILLAIERLDSLDQTSAGLFKDILVKFGPELEKENPAFIRSSLACVEEFLKRDGNDAGVRSVLREMLDLHRRSLNKHSDRISLNDKDIQNTETKWKATGQQGNLTLIDSTESKVCRAISQDSGYGDLDDMVLWNSEDSFIQDVGENLKSYNEENADKDVDSAFTEETGSKKASHEFLSKHFGKPIVAEEKKPLYSTERHWSDTVSKQKDISYTCQSKQREEFTKLKDNPKMDNQARTGFGEVWTSSDRWTRGSEEKFNSQRTYESRKSAIGADQESWRKLPVRAGFGSPGKMSTVPEEESGSDELDVIPRRPKHLIRKFQMADSNGKGKLVVERNPLGPGSDPSVIADVEKGLPKSIYSACGRRAMFKKYNTAVCFEDIDSDDLEEKEKISYSREELLKLADSPLSKQKPTESSYLLKIFPEVCLPEAKKYFSSADLPSDRPLDSRFLHAQARKNKHDEVTGFLDRFSYPDNTQTESSRNSFLSHPDNTQNKSSRNGFLSHTDNTQNESSRNGFLSHPDNTRNESSRNDFLLLPDNSQNESSRNSFLYPTPKFEFGGHRGFPQSSLPIATSATQGGDRKAVFGSSASFIPQDFSTCAQVTTTVTGIQRGGFGRPT